MDKFDGMLTTEIFGIWGYKPKLRDENFQKDVYIMNKKIVWIEPTLFHEFTTLTILDISNNMLIGLNDQMFKGLINLKKLYLNNNRIESLSYDSDQRKLFEGLNKLEVLHLNNNKIQSLPEYAFKELTSLLELKLQSNYIKSIHYESLTGLLRVKELDLKNNYISFISADAFQGCDDLCASLDQNKIDDIFGKWYHFVCNPICKRKLRLMPNNSIIFD